VTHPDRHHRRPWCIWLCATLDGAARARPWTRGSACSIRRDATAAGLVRLDQRRDRPKGPGFAEKSDPEQHRRRARRRDAVTRCRLLRIVEDLPALTEASRSVSVRPRRGWRPRCKRGWRSAPLRLVLDAAGAAALAVGDASSRPAEGYGHRCGIGLVAAMIRGAARRGYLRAAAGAQPSVKTASSRGLASGIVASGPRFVIAAERVAPGAHRTSLHRQIEAPCLRAGGFAAHWDFAAESATTGSMNRRRTGLHGRTAPRPPKRAVTGADGTGPCRLAAGAPALAAIHFHADDLYDAGCRRA